MNTRNRDETTLPARLLPNPSVDRLLGVTKVDLTAADIAANRAQLDALDRVHTMLASMRRIQIATLIFVGLLATFVVVMTYVRNRQFDQLEQRVEKLERAQENRP